MAERCPECGDRVPSKDHLADHLSDEHDAFDWIMSGRPIMEGSA
ncbi:hypothetical protein [Haladaptatus pallidirubidus]|nr:hypothetical protein [Haladaptatus pallidirubidus]